MKYTRLAFGALIVIVIATTLLVQSFLRPALTEAKGTPIFQVQLTSDIPYGPLPDETLDIYAPIGKNTASTAFVFIHGGDWTFGSKTDHSDIANWLASQGYVVASINYRLVQGESTTTPPNPNETNIWPDQIVDAQLAVRWLRTNAGTYKVAKHRICAMGQSAGGQLALMLGMLSYRYPGDESTVLRAVSPQADCVIDNSGPTNLDFTVNGTVPYQIAGLVDSLDPALIHTASPIGYATGTTSPIAITQGTSDPLAPPGEPQDLYNLLLADGASTTAIWYDGGHVFRGLTWQQETAVLSQALAYVNAQF